MSGELVPVDQDVELMNTARFIKDVRAGGAAHWKLYKLTPPLDGNDYVIVSAANVFFSGPETYIFPANEHGDVTDWCELEGSFRGALDHRRALLGAGYSAVGEAS